MWLLNFIGHDELKLPSPGLQMCEINYFAFYYFLQKYFLVSFLSLLSVSLNSMLVLEKYSNT